LRTELESIVFKRTRTAAEVRRIKASLLAADGMTDLDIGEKLDMRPPTAARGRKRFIKEGIEGLRDRPKPPSPPVYGPKKTKEDITATPENPPPKGLSEWTLEGLAVRLGISVYKVRKVLRAAQISPGPRGTWRVRNDPGYALKAAAVQALKTSPPEGSVVVGVDGKPSIQAIERPSGWARNPNGKIIRADKSTYVRHGTANPFTAYFLQSGSVASSPRGKRMLTVCSL
jgi:transposase